jgi:RNA polymerase sigma-70 factor (ECF subfamily)
LTAETLSIPHRLTAADFAALYEDHLTAVYRYCLARTGNPAEAEDLSAETFRAALESMADYDPDRGTTTVWLFGIARRKVANHYRKEHPELSLEWAENHPDETTSSPEDAVDGRLTLAQAADALQRLSPARAEALALHFFAGLGISEVAVVMKRRPAAAKKLVQRGLSDLRKILGG